MDEDGQRRIDNDADWVRIEIESALTRDIPVVPLLVKGARLPKADQLPGSLKNLAYRNAAIARAGRDFHRDMDVLIRDINATPVRWVPPTNPPQPTIKTIKIFLASSSELKADREQFEILINRKTKETIKDSIFLELVIWEDFLNAMSKTRSQDEYNRAIAECDLFVLLAHTKVGEYTNEEFLTALETFKDSDKPLIYTYFKDAAINMSRITPDIMTLLNFKQQLSDMGHFYQHYADINDLKHQFSEQLVKLMPRW